MLITKHSAWLGAGNPRMLRFPKIVHDVTVLNPEFFSLEEGDHHPDLVNGNDIYYGPST